MTDEKDKILYDDQFDVTGTMLEDMVPSSLIKVYPYELVNSKDGDAFVMDNAVSIASISQANIDVSKLKLDSVSGKYYFEVFAAITKTGVLDFARVTSTFGQEFKEESSFSALTNWFPDNFIKEGKLGDTNFTPSVYSIDIPFDRVEYEKGNQSIFIASNINEAKESLDDSDNMIDSEGYTELQLINISTIEAQFTNSRIFFTESIVTLNNPQVDLSAAKDGSDMKPGFTLGVGTTSLINKISARGIINGIDESIDLKTDIKLPWLKGTPVDNNDEVSIFMDWFDYDSVMPQYIAKSFANASGIEMLDLKNLAIDTGQGTDAYFGDKEINLIFDLLELTTAYASSWGKPFRRVDDQSSQSYGKLLANQTITSAKIPVQSLEGKNPIEVIDGIFDSFLRDNPTMDGTNKMKAIREIINGLSRFIKSTNAISKGANSFHEVYLPWFIRPTSGSLTLTEDSNHNYSINRATKFKLFSRWFDVDPVKGPVPSVVKDLSNVRMIQTDRKLTLPVVPDILNIVNKLPLPGDVDTKSSRDLQYMWLLPLEDEAQFNRLFLNNPNITVDNTNIDRIIAQTEVTGENQELITDAQKDAWIMRTALKVTGLPESQLTVKSRGTLIEIWGNEQTRVIRKLFTFRGLSLWPINNHQATPLQQKIIDKFYAGAANSNSGVYLNSKDMTEEERNYLFAFGLGLDRLNIKPINEFALVFGSDNNWNIQTTEVVTDNRNMATSTWRWQTKSYRIDGAVVTIAGKSTSVSFDRKTLFDKAQWNKFIKQTVGISKEYLDINLVEEDEIKIDKLKEIVVRSIWGDNLVVNINGERIIVPTFNVDNEAVTVQRILFT